LGGREVDLDIWHRIALRSINDLEYRLGELGIKYKLTRIITPTNPMISFDISETDPRWPAVAELIQATPHPTSDIWETFFADDEVFDAAWVRLVPIFQRGFPQPQNTWIEDPHNYADHCPQCGTYRQIASYRLKQEPKLGAYDFYSMHWIYELFCTPRVFAELVNHRVRGYETWDAIIHKTGRRSQAVSQLFVPGIASAGLRAPTELMAEHCSLCGVTKYSPHARGVMYIERGSLPSDTDVILSYEWFGSGHQAYREILASHKVAALILGSGWKGVRMKVVELV
jgi:hypothetical protein